MDLRRMRGILPKTKTDAAGFPRPSSWRQSFMQWLDRTGACRVDMNCRNLWHPHGRHSRNVDANPRANGGAAHANDHWAEGRCGDVNVSSLGLDPRPTRLQPRKLGLFPS